MNHAYAILQVKEYNNQLLLQLRNPHGSKFTTLEWMGDWADDSEQWDTRAMARLKYKPETDMDAKPDGIFWMNSTDLLHNFKYFYTCRVLSQKNGWFKSEQRGNLVNSGNKDILPQYKLKITEPGTAFIQIRQLGENASTYKGNNYFMFICSDEKGGKMKKILRRNVIGNSKMSNALVKGDELFFNKGHTYPKVFTITIMTKSDEDLVVTEQPDFEIAAYTKELTTLEAF